MWQHIMYLCVRCFQCSEVRGLQSKYLPAPPAQPPVKQLCRSHRDSTPSHHSEHTNGILTLDTAPLRISSTNPQQQTSPIFTHRHTHSPRTQAQQFVTTPFKRAQKTIQPKPHNVYSKHLYAWTEISVSYQAESYLAENLHQRSAPHTRSPEINHKKSLKATRPTEPDEAPSKPTPKLKTRTSDRPSRRSKDPARNCTEFTVFFHASFYVQPNFICMKL